MNKIYKTDKILCKSLWDYTEISFLSRGGTVGEGGHIKYWWSRSERGVVGGR